ncbi:uncharacterized protein LOC144700033 [Wolffia australiana]
MATIVHERSEVAELWPLPKRNQGSAHPTAGWINDGVLSRGNRNRFQISASGSTGKEGGETTPVVLSRTRARLLRRPRPHDVKSEALTDDPTNAQSDACRIESPQTIVANLEDDLRKLFDQISKSGKPVYHVNEDLSSEFKHIECCDEVNQWALNLLMNVPGDDEWRITIERMVYKVLFEHINKTKLCGDLDSGTASGSSKEEEKAEDSPAGNRQSEEMIMEMLSWLKEVAKSPLCVMGSNLENNSTQLERMAISAREALFLDVREPKDWEIMETTDEEIRLKRQCTRQYLEEDLRKLLDQISKSGKPVFHIHEESAEGSGQIECCDEITRWALNLLMNTPGNDEWRIEIERVVYEVLFEHMNKTESCSRSDSGSASGSSAEEEDPTVSPSVSQNSEDMPMERVPCLNEVVENARLMTGLSQGDKSSQLALFLDDGVSGIESPQTIIKQQSPPQDYLVVENLEEKLRELLHQISKSGKPVYRINEDSTRGSEQIECCDEVTQWALNLLKDMPGDDEWRTKIERMVYNVLFEHINKTKYCCKSDSDSARGSSSEEEAEEEEPEISPTTSPKSQVLPMEMLSWLKEVAENPLGMIEPPPNDENNSRQLENMVFSAREALFLSVRELSAADECSFHHTKKQKTQVGGASDQAATDPSGRIQCDCGSEFQGPTRPQRRSIRSPSRAEPRKQVPVGPSFQAEIPDLAGGGSESRWLGTSVWPRPEAGSDELGAAGEIGRGRPEACGCPVPGNVVCVRSHVAESRVRLRLSLGRAFTELGLGEMGEELSGAWTLKEQRAVEALVRRRRFVGRAVRRLGSKKRREVMGFYFNAVVLRRMGAQTRLLGGLADSDDDEFDLRPYERIYPRAAYKLTD